MPAFPNGHFYSPVPDFYRLEQDQNRIWRQNLELPGVDLDLAGQRRLLERCRPLVADYRFPERGAGKDAEEHFHEPNGFFEKLDSRMLFCLLRLLRPRRLIEVGSGFSSLLAAEVNVEHFGGSIDVTCIEPYPRAFLRRGVPGIGRLIQSPVEEVEWELFSHLEAGDVLFIDSSHVIKTGNDVHFLYLEVLPRLPPGVVIHCHDIFLPFEYPKHWVLEERRAWNEQYLLRALLTHSRGFQVLFGSACAAFFFPDQVADVFGRELSGASFWIQKT